MRLLSSLRMTLLMASDDRRDPPRESGKSCDDRLAINKIDNYEANPDNKFAPICCNTRVSVRKRCR